MATTAGITSATQWQQFSNDTVVVSVTLDGHDANPPAITANLVCDSQSQVPTAGIRIQNPSQAMFTALLQLASGADLSVADAQRYNWRVSWIAKDPT